jgi:hypothetical protein
MSKENIVFEGKTFWIVQTLSPDGTETWETARRTPGFRLIIKNPDGTFKLSREFRHEHGSEGVRLPGGKVFRTLKEYSLFLESGKDIGEEIKRSVAQEAEEELGVINPKNTKLIEKSVLGATVEWDLYVFEVSDFELGKQNLHGSEIVKPVDLTKQQILEAIDNGDFNEDRIVPVLLRYLKNN